MFVHLTEMFVYLQYGSIAPRCKVRKNKTNMETKTKTLKQPKLPPFLPFGWMSEVAAILGVHRNTISRNVKKGSGPMYDRIVRTAAAKYGSKEGR